MDRVKCDRCGEPISDPYCVIGVFLSGSSKSYRFCDKCYKDITKVMESKDEVPLNLVEVRKRFIEATQEFSNPVRMYPLRYYWPAKYPQIELINMNAHRARRAVTSVTA